MSLRTSLLLPLILLAAGSLRAVDTIRPSELKAGDEGYFLTEVENGEIFSSPVRVLGVLDASMPGGDLILIRLLAPRFEKSGVAAGMSGSPVYIRGRLAGALAYAWPFASEPVAGVTPFSRMMEETSPEDGGDPGGATLPSPGQLASAIRDSEIAALAEELLSPENAQEGPAPLPFSLGAGGALSAFRPGGWLGTVFSRMGWALTPTGGGAAGGEPEGELKPGSMIAAVLVDGDARLAAGGTVTEIRGDRVWAFGHPFLRAGAVRMPMARASVVTILPSMANSFKFFNTGAEIGSFLSDRRHGIQGIVGTQPAMIPFHLEYASRSFDFRLLDHRLLTPLLAAYLVQGIDSVRGAALLSSSAAVSLEIAFDDDRDIRLEQVFEGGNAVAGAAAWLSALTAYLKQSTFEAPAIRNISCRLDISEGSRRRKILDAIPSRSRLSPGENFELRLRLLAPDGGIELRKMALKVPMDAAPGPLQLVLADGVSWAAYDLNTRPELVESFSDQLRILGRLFSTRTAVAAFEAPGRCLVTRSGSVALPAGVLMNLRAARLSQMDTVAWRLLDRVELPMEFPLLGAMRIRLKVEAPGFERGE